MTKQLQDKVKHYLREVLGIALEYSDWERVASFPNHLQDAYRFQHCELLGRNFLLFLSYDPEFTPAAIEKHINWVGNKTGMRGVFVADSIESYNRKRLIERKIPFIVPENQLYLPDLALDLREHLKKAKNTVDKLSPASQVIVLSFLLGRLADAEALSPTGLSKQFSYSKMSMSRSLDELRALELVETLHEGKNAFSKFVCSGWDLWAKAKPFLRTPVKKRIYLDELFHKLSYKTGEYALDELTMLASRREAWAVTSKEWKELQGKDTIHMIPEVSKDMAHTELEIWSYAPSLLSDGPTVDRLSLVLSLQDQKDERVEMAVDELMDRIVW